MGQTEPPSLEDISRIVGEWADGNEYVAEVWLFGSYAKGTQRPESDIDLAVKIRGRDGETPSGVWSGDRARWEFELAGLLFRPVQIEMLDPDFAPNVVEACQEHGQLLYSDA
jgi:predicted nucleotidyltransferase